jgi:hypothetical protein
MEVGWGYNRENHILMCLCGKIILKNFSRITWPEKLKFT